MIYLFIASLIYYDIYCKLKIIKNGDWGLGPIPNPQNKNK